MKTHNLKLQNKPFVSIKNGEKTIEMRLFDEKRKQINIGDEIIFTNITNGDTMAVKVQKISIFKNFDELYKNFEKTKLGYSENEPANASDMNEDYSLEEQSKFGVCAIEIEKI